jgi:hypothetical protein
MAQKQHFQAHKADGMCLLIGPVSPVLFSLSSPSSLSLQREKGRQRERGRIQIGIKLTSRTEKQSSLPDQTNESVNSPTSPHPPISL